MVAMAASRSGSCGIGDADVLEHQRAAGADRREGLPPGLHEHLALVGVVGDEDVDGAGGLARLLHRGDLFAARGRGRVRLRKEQRAGRTVEPHGSVVLDRVDRGVVHQLQHGRTQLLPDGHDRAGRRVDVREDGDHRGARRLRRDEPQDRAGDDAEGALAADEQLEQAQPGDVLDALAAEGHQRAVGEHDVEAEHVVGGDAVLHAAESAGVGGDVAADRADLERRRVGRVPEPVLGGGDLHLTVECAGLDHGHLADGVDLDRPHALHAEDDTAVDGARSTGQTAAGSSGNDRDAVLCSPPDAFCTCAASSTRTTAIGVPAFGSRDQSKR